MTWVKVDDRLHNHRKTRKVTSSHPTKRRDAAAMGLWVLAASWAGLNSRDGWVPEFELDRWDDDWESLIERLVKAGFWIAQERDGEPGYVFNDWEQYNWTEEGQSRDGLYGNHVRWHANRGVVDENCPHCPVAPESPPDSDRTRPRIAPESPPESPPDSDRTPKSSPNPYPNPYPNPNPSGFSLGGATNETGPDDDEALIPAPDVDTGVPAKAGPPTTTTKAKAKRGTRLPDGWVPARTEANLTVEAGYGPEYLNDQLSRFRDYWKGATGQKATKLDWDATWRNWLRNSKGPTRSTNNGKPRTAGSITEEEWKALARGENLK